MDLDQVSSWGFVGLRRSGVSLRDLSVTVLYLTDRELSIQQLSSTGNGESDPASELGMI